MAEPSLNHTSWHMNQLSLNKTSPVSTVDMHACTSHTGQHNADAAVHLQLACCLWRFLCSGHGRSMHALAHAYAMSQYTLCACMHLPIKHRRAVLVAPEHAQLPSALGCIWLVIVSKLWGPSCAAKANIQLWRCLAYRHAEVGRHYGVFIMAMPLQPLRRIQRLVGATAEADTFELMQSQM